MYERGNKAKKKNFKIGTQMIPYSWFIVLEFQISSPEKKS